MSGQVLAAGVLPAPHLPEPGQLMASSLTRKCMDDPGTPGILQNLGADVSCALTADPTGHAWTVESVDIGVLTLVQSHLSLPRVG